MGHTFILNICLCLHARDIEKKNEVEMSFLRDIIWIQRRPTSVENDDERSRAYQ